MTDYVVAKLPRLRTGTVSGVQLTEGLDCNDSNQTAAGLSEQSSVPYGMHVTISTTNK
jgi:hypothetical protein